MLEMAMLIIIRDIYLGPRNNLLYYTQCIVTTQGKLVIIMLTIFIQICRIVGSAEYEDMIVVATHLVSQPVSGR